MIMFTLYVIKGKVWSKVLQRGKKKRFVSACDGLSEVKGHDKWKNDRGFSVKEAIKVTEHCIKMCHNLH